MTQPHTVIELSGEVTLLDGPYGTASPEVCAAGVPGHTDGFDTFACAALVDRATKRHEHEPTGRIRDLLTIEHRRVQALPGLAIADLQIALLQDDPACS
jgi:hypothetical protein